jgi:hypothetical protein
MGNNKLSMQDVDTYINALVYKPTNHVSDFAKSVTECSGCIARVYLFDRLTSLPQNLEHYSIDDSFNMNNIYDGPATLTSKGIGERKHVFLAHEGHDACHSCKEDVCHCYRGLNGDNIFCLSCLVTETIVPAHESIGSKTILEM